ncbi:MAG: hypothetical protein K2G87_04580, partial [Oscillospiraceae bacterium]|nr:hypothetical protein [Oscillospiraceae bacterium]
IGITLTISEAPKEVLQKFKEDLTNGDGLCISAITLAELKHSTQKSTRSEKMKLHLHSCLQP